MWEAREAKHSRNRGIDFSKILSVIKKKKRSK